MLSGLKPGAPWIFSGKLSDCRNWQGLWLHHRSPFRLALWRLAGGIDDIREEQHDLDQALAGIPEDAPVILLAHEPD